MGNNRFSLVHAICDPPNTPLLNTQVYERAYFQTNKGKSSPEQTFVFVFAALRTLLQNNYYKSIRSARKSFYPVRFVLVPFSSRLGPLLTAFTLRCYRFFFIKHRIIFHSRGETPVYWINKVKRKDDKMIIDVRGYTPIEIFARSNKFDPSDLSIIEKQVFLSYEENLRNVLKFADAIFTVSTPLAVYLKKRFNLLSDVEIIPCVTSEMKPDQMIKVNAREESINIVYLGGAQSYQSLKELILPFVKALTNLDERVVVHFVSQDKPIIDRYLKESGIFGDQTISVCLPQEEVGAYLLKMDLGLILRSPSFMNSFSQPVKMGEYLASGVGIVFEKGTGDLRALLQERGIGFEVELWNRDNEHIECEARRLLSWFDQNCLRIKAESQNFIFTEYNWNRYSIMENNVYHRLLGDRRLG